jgi:hypothetical protein
LQVVLIFVISWFLCHSMLNCYCFKQKTPRYFYSPRYSPAALVCCCYRMYELVFVPPFFAEILRWFIYVQGASGAVTSIMLLNIFLHPKQIIFFQMFIPMPAALLVSNLNF